MELVFQCGKCKKVFSHQPNVSRHVKNCQVRKTKTGHKCKKCEKVLDLVLNLRDICSPIQIQTIRSASVVGHLNVQIILQNI